mmetsp:Transcript_10962/g.32196  ORF Transcript_10962/g.32196 Transcript_10962/m.32196 type:complete len:320 (+) Transcript_10962:1762-2721(+)
MQPTHTSSDVCTPSSGCLLLRSQFGSLLRCLVISLDLEQDLARPYPRADARRELEAAVEPPVKRVDLLARRRQPLAQHRLHIAGDALRDGLLAKVVRLLAVRKGPADEDRSARVCVEHRASLLPCEEAELSRVVQDGLALCLAVGASADKPEVRGCEGRVVLAARAKVNHRQLARARLVQKVGPVGIRLHEAKLEELREGQPQQPLPDPVALRGLDGALRGRLVDGQSRHPLCCQHVLRGELRHDGGHGQLRVRGEQLLEPGGVCRLALVVALLQQLLARHLEHPVEVEAGRDHAGVPVHGCRCEETLFTAPEGPRRCT